NGSSPVWPPPNACRERSACWLMTWWPDSTVSAPAGSPPRSSEGVPEVRSGLVFDQSRQAVHRRPQLGLLGGTRPGEPTFVGEPATAVGVGHEGLIALGLQLPSPQVSRRFLRRIAR